MKVTICQGYRVVSIKTVQIEQVIELESDI